MRSAHPFRNMASQTSATKMRRREMSKEPFMESDNGYFTAEQVDEQIDQLRQANTKDGLGDEARLVKSLRLYHKTPLLAEDRAALEHARQRIAGTARDMGTFDDPVLVVTMPPARPAAHARGRRFVRLL